MARPKTEHGFVMLALDILPAIAEAANLSNSALITIVNCLGYYYGPRKRESIRMTAGDAANETGIGRSPASRAINELVQANILLRNGKEYSFNKDYESWTPHGESLESRLDGSLLGGVKDSVDRHGLKASSTNPKPKGKAKSAPVQQQATPVPVTVQQQATPVPVTVQQQATPVPVTVQQQATPVPVTVQTPAHIEDRATQAPASEEFRSKNLYYSSEKEMAASPNEEQHPPVPPGDQIANSAPTTCKRDADSNNAMKILGAIRTIHLANDIDIHECDYFFRELPGWKLLQAVRVIKDGGADNMGFLKKVAFETPRRDNSRTGESLACLETTERPSGRSVNSPSMQMGGIDPDVLASVEPNLNPCRDSNHDTQELKPTNECREAWNPSGGC